MKNYLYSLDIRIMEMILEFDNSTNLVILCLFKKKKKKIENGVHHYTINNRERLIRSKTKTTSRKRKDTSRYLNRLRVPFRLL